MKILFVATKIPWPPIDGGRLLLAETLSALSAAGHSTTLVAPLANDAEQAHAQAACPEACSLRLVSARPMVAPLAFLRARALDLPFSIARHSLPAVRREVAFALAQERFDVVHVEQLQALTQAADALDRGLPTVLRAQNVESELWHGTARRASGWRARWLGHEAQRLASWEGAAIARVDAAVAISSLDADKLRELGRHRAQKPDEIRVRYAPAPFPLGRGQAASPLDGSPSIIVLGSGGWPPNREGAVWFAQEVWPAIRATLPEAKLHLFGRGLDPHSDVSQATALELARDAGLVVHEAPKESIEAFAPGSILAVPLRVASGIRMKILEAWARGIPVVATPEAISGLDAHDGREVLIARDPKSFARAISRLVREPGLAAEVAAAGKRLLARSHDPHHATRELLAVYSDVIHRRASRNERT